MKKIVTSLILIISQILLYTPNALANLAKEKVECGTKTGYELYKCRVKKICEIYKPKKIIYEVKKEDNYEKITSSEKLKKTKEKYRKNMNNIYKCAILKTQKKSLNTLKQKLLKPIDKSGEITNKIEGKINLRMQKIDTIFRNLGCREYENEKLNQKLTVLNQTVYELCRYTNYLEYIKDYNSSLENLLGISEEEIGNKETKKKLEDKKYNINYITSLKQQKDSEIDNEMEHSFKVFPLAYHAYSEYENNFIIHVLLELIREDLIVFRNKLHQVLSPISQVVYKISNAMSK